MHLLHVCLLLTQHASMQLIGFPIELLVTRYNRASVQVFRGLHNSSLT